MADPSSPARPILIYFHGVPGAVEERRLLQAAAEQWGVDLQAVARFDLASDLTGEPYFHALAKRVEALAAGRRVTLMGFSMGAFVALRVAPYLSSPPSSLHLVSAAAPLESGDFLDQMAGRAVFEAARRSESALARLTGIQAWMTRWAPGLLYRMIFGSAQGGDRPLSEEAGFRHLIRSALAGSLGPGREGYLRDLRGYVAPWSASLAMAPLCATWIWQGTEDNWSPPGMAGRLAELLPGSPSVTMIKGASHYSCLVAAGPQIFEIEAGAGEQA